MTERTVPVEREETIAICDVCGKDAEAYDNGELVMFASGAPQAHGALHFHERCIADIDKISVPRDEFGTFSFSFGNTIYRTDDIQQVLLRKDGLCVGITIAVFAASAFGIGTLYSPTVTGAMLSIGFFILSALTLVLYAIRASKIAGKVKKGLDR